MQKPNPSCPDCVSANHPTRRQILKVAAGGAAALTAASAGMFSLGVTPRFARAGAEVVASGATPAAPETLVAQLFKSLTDEQKKLITFPFEHPLRSQVDNNWHIVKQPIGKTLTPEQHALVKEIFVDLHSEEYAAKVVQQVEHDNEEDDGFAGCAIALFGEPGDRGDGGKSKFEFVFTGRHVTRRCDGNSVEGEAFGGPIFYGHAAAGFHETATHPGNIYWYQALQANEVFKAMDGKQRSMALRSDPRREQGSKTVALRGKDDGIPGIPMTELANDQKDLVRKVMADLLAPFRKRDADEALKMIEDGGFDHLRMAFYQGPGLDIGNDGVWDVWQIEGPSMVWYFRGAPHVHTWVHVREPDKA